MRNARSRSADVLQQIQDSSALSGALADQASVIIKIADDMVRAFRNGNKVLLFGNGGSAADAEHIACELSGKFTLYRDPLPAIALTTNTSSLTAIANDFGYEDVFARQLRGLVVKGDIVIGISTSGTSPNVIAALKEGKRRGAVTVAFTGAGGNLKDIAHRVLSIPSTNTPRIQEAHIVAGHIICYLVEASLFARAKPSNRRTTRSR